MRHYCGRAASVRPTCILPPGMARRMRDSSSMAYHEKSRPEKSRCTISVAAAGRGCGDTPGIVRFGNAVAAGGAQFCFVRKSSLAPGEKVMFQDKIASFELLAPGRYRLHVYLFSRYATELNKRAGTGAGVFHCSVTLSSPKDR